jgi:hypothetical protein
MREATVTKRYFEDSSGAPDETRGHEEEYRYWDYTFDFAERAYRVRIYTDEPDHADVRQGPAARVQLVNRLRSVLFRRDESPLADPSERDGPGSSAGQAPRALVPAQLSAKRSPGVWSGHAALSGLRGQSGTVEGSP